MQRTALTILLFCASLSVCGQGLNEMSANRFSYVSLGGAFPYVSARMAYVVTHNTYIELRGLTDGGGVWKENVELDGM